MTPIYIDIHNHILPGLDDGPETIELSLEMARIAHRNGIFKIVATPHHNDYWRPRKEEIIEKLERLNNELADKNIPVEIFPGNELRVADDLPEKLYNREVLPLAGSRYILVEFPFNNIPIYIISVVADLINDGWRPVLAHCERVYDIQQNIKLLDNYINMGCMVQVNSNSLTGELGRSSYKTAIQLLKLGYVDIIASDAHSPHNRIPDFSKALKIASKIVGRAKAEAMVSVAPEKILEDQTV
jgi:protein-tyrosine phosphatase